MRGARAILGIGALVASVAGAEPARPLVVASRGLASIVVSGSAAPGLRAGERLSVVRGEQVIGELEVSAAGASSASCRIVSQRLPIGVGDRLVLPAAAAEAAATSPAPASRPAAPVAPLAPLAAPQSTLSASTASSTASPAKPAAGSTPVATAPATAGVTPTVASKPAAPAGVTPATATGAGAPVAPLAARATTTTAVAPATVAAPVATAPATAAPVARPATTATATAPATANGATTASAAPTAAKPAAPPTAATPPATAPPTVVTPAASKPTLAVATAPAPAAPVAKAATAPTAAPATANGATTASAAPTAAKPAAPPTATAPPATAPPTVVTPAASKPTVVEAASSAAPPKAGARFAVKYRSASNVYLDGGRAHGLGPMDRLRVFSGATSVAELEVVFAAEQSASCRVVSETRPVQAGDVAVRMTPEVGVKALVAAASTTPSATAAPLATSTASTGSFAGGGGRTSFTGPWARVRGSASIGLYRTWDQTDSNYDFQERTGRLDLGLYDISGKPLSFTVRGRSRQDIRARTLAERTPQSERVDRLYEVALRYEPPSDNVGIEAGRIGIYRFVGIGYLDGVLARFRPVRLVQVGGFAGRNADVETLGYGGTGRKYGGFVRLAPGGRWATGAYDATLAFVREDAESDVSREYLSLESRFGSGSRWSLFERAELDLNRGWRQEATGKSYQLSNVSVSGNLRVASSAWAYVSYDGRRNYRYYLNRVVPEEVFDDLLHQGLRAGINLNRSGGFGATAGFGMTLKEPDPRNPELEIANAYSFNGGVRHSALFGTPLSAGLDFSGYSNGYTDGGLLLARLGRRFTGGHMLDLSYGRSVYRLKSTNEDRTTQFFRLMGRGELVRRVYIQGDFEYDTGDDLKGPRGFLELGVLF